MRTGVAFLPTKTGPRAGCCRPQSSLLSSFAATCRRVGRACSVIKSSGSRRRRCNWLLGTAQSGATKRENTTLFRIFAFFNGSAKLLLPPFPYFQSRNPQLPCCRADRMVRGVRFPPPRLRDPTRSIRVWRETRASARGRISSLCIIQPFFFFPHLALVIVRRDLIAGSVDGRTFLAIPPQQTLASGSWQPPCLHSIEE